jgi:hypothetical protein
MADDVFQPRFSAAPRRGGLAAPMLLVLAAVDG